MDDCNIVEDCSIHSNKDDSSKNVILSIDVGSSSIRCTAYDVSTTTVLPTAIKVKDDATTIGNSSSSSTESLLHNNTSEQQQQPIYTSIASYQCPRKSIDPYTGQVLIDIIKNNIDENEKNPTIQDNLFDTIDSCMDHVVQQLIEVQEKQQQQHGSKCINVIAIGFTTFVMNLIGTNEYGVPLGNYATMSYACQSDVVQDEVIKLKSLLGPNGIQNLYQTTGVPIHPAYALPQLLSWYNERNSKSTDVHQWQTIASICIRRWITDGRTASNVKCKSFPISFSEASWTGLLNFRTCQYEQQVLQLLPQCCIDALPDLVDYDGYSMLNDTEITYNITSNEDTESYTNPYWTRWSLLCDSKIKFFFGIGDGACANIGSKCTTLNRIACTIGTSAAARVCMYYPTKTQQQVCPQSINNENEVYQTDLIIPSGLFCYRIDRYHVLIGGALTDGGNIVEWINHLMKSHSGSPMTSTFDCESSIQQAKQLLCDEYDDYIKNMSATNDCNTSGSKARAPQLILVPFFSGERSTGYRSNSTGTIVGLTLQTRSHHIMKAGLEGVALRLSVIIQLIQNVVEESQRNSCPNNVAILCSGKALEKNELWRMMIADSTGLPVYMEDQTNEGTSRGVATLIYYSMFIRHSTHTRQCNESIIFDKNHFLTESVILQSTNGLIQAKTNLRGYWTNLLITQEAIINVLSNTLNWS